MFLRLVPATLLLIMAAGCSRPAAPPEPVRSVRTLVLAAGTAQGEQVFAAEIKARTESRLGFRVGGKLLWRFAEPGQKVTAGQVLAELDPQDLRLAQDAAQAAVSAAKVGADQARSDLVRFKGLFDQGFISAAELQRRESTLQAADAQLNQARAQAAVQGNLAGYSRLLAPADGVITAVEAEPGMVLAAGAPVVRLAHAGARDVVFAVPEDRVASLRSLLGRAGGVQVQLWGREQIHAAKLREVAAAADPTTRTFTVRAEIGALAADLGQTATVTLKSPVQAGVLRLPLSALLEDKGRTVVWQLDATAMTVRMQAIQVAGADGNEALIASGLIAGAEIVTAGVHVLSEGQKVTRYQAVASPAAR